MFDRLRAATTSVVTRGQLCLGPQVAEPLRQFFTHPA
jgi:hypothetical protein